MEIDNVQVVGIERSIAAIKNAYNIGPINTSVTKVSEKELEVAKKLGNDSTAYQSHDAFLAGIVVNFDMYIENEAVEISFLEKILTGYFFTVTGSAKKPSKFHVNTNYRALKHFLKRYPEEKSFREWCNNRLELFQELTNKIEEAKKW